MLHVLLEGFFIDLLLFSEFLMNGLLQLCHLLSVARLQLRYGTMLTTRAVKDHLTKRTDGQKDLPTFQSLHLPPVTRPEDIT